MSVLALFVEDDEVFANVYLRGFESAGVAVMHVRTLSRAVSELQERKFDAVILDLRLGDSSGEATFNEVYRVAKGARIVVFTAIVDADVRERMTLKGAIVREKDGTSPSELAGLLREAAGKRPAASESQWDEHTQPGIGAQVIPLGYLREFDRRLEPVQETARKSLKIGEESLRIGEENQRSIEGLHAKVDDISTSLLQASAPCDPLDTIAPPRSTTERVKRAVGDLDWLSGIKKSLAGLALAIAFTLLNAFAQRLGITVPPPSTAPAQIATER